jgi:triacylglycerol lipase
LRKDRSKVSHQAGSLTPVVLVHGLCGFSKLFAPRRPAKEYFPGVGAALQAVGHPVLHARLSPTGSIATRAVELKAFIRKEVGQRAVHVVGHSLGGLDGRFLISRLGMETQVRSLTTLGTPHRGTAFADWGISRLARWLVPMLRACGISTDAFFDLTTDQCRRFNETVPDAPGVRYASVAGECAKPYLGAEWQLPSVIVGRAEGPNDGVVSVASAAWGERQDVWAGDHLNLVNWPNRKMRKAGLWHDRGPHYADLLARL